MPRELTAEEIVSDAEPLDEVLSLKRVPNTPFAFIWFLISSHFRLRVLAMAGCALAATCVEAFAPVAFSHLVNSITAAVKTHGAFATVVLPWIIWLAAIWFGSATIYRLYDWVDLNTGPRMRGLAQKYLFVYMLGHSPRYFQDNFAGKLGQKVKQAGQATIGILGIVCMDVVRVVGL
ncbi:MAG: ABC transporter ATP-binding protein, partial [Alphaproteobacteria bacterium]|nr:ABC transporter ATP-binding protein [Alphaproteobacteria bacterium]